MALHLNIHGGTRSNSDSLCRTCHFAGIIRGPAESNELVHCGMLQNSRINFRVQECTYYHPYGQLFLGQMAQIAWEIELAPKREYGFKGERDVVIKAPGEQQTANYPAQEPAPFIPPGRRL